MLVDDLTQIPLEEASFCIVDVETTGLSPQSNNIIEIGLVKVSNMTIVDKYQSLVNPGRTIPYYITSLTGISDSDIETAPFFEEIIDEVSEFIGDSVITAHNLSFDKSFLKKEFAYLGKSYLTNLSLCTLRVARRIYPMLRSKSLGSICNHLSIKNSSAHRALADAEVTARLLIKMIDEVKLNHECSSVGNLLNLQYVPRNNKPGVKIKKSLGKDVSVLPDCPGIYYFLNSKNQVIYIGKAKSLRDRVRSYFSPSAPRKAKKIIKQASRVKIQITNSELTALLNEAESIKEKNPRHNTLLKQYGNKYFLRITASEEFPRLEICNYFDFDGNDYFGLFISRKKAAALYDVISRAFSVRECSDEEFSRGKACFLAQIQRCTAPCENTDKQLYSEELSHVYDFLYGKNQVAVTRLLHKMKEYSSKLKFEKAGEIKELVDMILAQTHKTSLLAEPVNSANVLFEINEGFQRDYILMLTGRIYIKTYSLNEKDGFEDALDDFYAGTSNLNMLPGDEDMEKMKITLNWLVKNRNKVRYFYLKNYLSKGELYSHITKYLPSQPPQPESFFDISELQDLQDS